MKHGEFLPLLTFGTGNSGVYTSANTAGITYQYRWGVWEKQGLFVHFAFGFILTNKGTATGDCYIFGLPKMPMTLVGGQMPIYTFCDLMGTNITSEVGGVVNISGPTVELLRKSAGNSVVLTNADFTNGSQVHVSGKYLSFDQ